MIKKSSSRISRLRRNQVDEVLSPFQRYRRIKAPVKGWLHEVRSILGLSATQVAARMGITQSAVSQLERREAEGAITLNSLSQAADALDCDLFYVLVPRAGSLTSALEARARKVATDTVNRVSHTMGLEDQAVSEREQREQVDDLVRELMDNPRALWTRDVV
jgi:predicted DNA-binding mobile mystery protein A